MTSSPLRPLSLQDFAAAYPHSGDFPARARERIPPSLWTALDAGNEAFFAPLKAHQPLTYRVLTQDCSPISLLEHQWQNPRKAGAVQSNFHWGTLCGDRLVVANLPLAEPQPDLMADDLRALPDALRGYYGKMDGMTIPGALPSAMVDNDLPASRTHWRNLDDYRQRTFRAKKKLEKIGRDFRGHELKVILYGTRGDLILVDYTAKDERLIHVKDHDFDGYCVLPDAAARLDRYFANAIRGFPESLDLRGKN